MPILETDSKWDRLAKGYYQKCLDEEELEKTGLTAIKEIVNWVGGWPTLQGQRWIEWEHSWEEQLALMMNRTGVNAVILELAVTHDPSNSSNSVIELDQPKWGVGSRWPYLMGPDDPMLKNYTHLMTLTAVALGAEPKLAEREMYEAMELELKLVNFSADDMVRRDPDRGNNRFQLWQLKSHFPLIDFEKYINTVFKGLANVSPNHTVIIREIEYFAGIQHILSTTPKRIIANYIAWRLVQGFSPFLPPTAREPFYQFKANQTGMFNSPPPDRWEDCVTLSVIMMDMPVGKLFVEHFFEKDRALAKMRELTGFLKHEFIKQLHVLDWMDESTRRRAVEKAHMIEYKNGFPEVLFNDTWMDQHWGMLIKPDEYLLHLTIRIKLARYAEELMRLDQPLDRWEDCVTLSVIMMDMPVGKLFVEHFFEKDRALAKMRELTGFLKHEFIKQLHVLDWMDESTRRRAVEKAHMIEYKNGFPEVLFNDTWMDQHWGMLIKPDEYLLHLTIRIKLARYAEELMRLDQPLDRSMWYQSPAQVDAYYAPNNNEMIFPAGIMQFPFLTLGVPNYITYGMVGAVIGHEVSHAFDDQGGRYDELGNLNDWWDTETAEKFTEKTRCFVRQYGSVKVEEAGIHLNGQLSLGENIADNGGVKTAFNAYKAWRANTSTEEPALPGFQNFTSEQMFFLAYANVSTIGINSYCSTNTSKTPIAVHLPFECMSLHRLQTKSWIRVEK
ncbi:peptidase family M13 [Oesophagostomum dentatum]|uniref:Peptidase family M13 n=1 Tax=Oesophagostomum dentatum TaxID=61180 RepID=A0A0B1T0Z5_OESDE|nr:peptidase family M13 [Oesophagostomum dentatum]